MTDRQQYELIETKRRCKELESECQVLKGELSDAQRVITLLKEVIGQHIATIENNDKQFDKLHEYTEKVVRYLVSCTEEDRKRFAAQFDILPVSQVKG